jgi:hypothetical protein
MTAVFNVLSITELFLVLRIKPLTIGKHEVKVNVQGQGAKSTGHRAESKKHRAQSKEQRAEGKGQRAQSREQIGAYEVLFHVPQVPKVPQVPLNLGAQVMFLGVKSLFSVLLVKSSLLKKSEYYSSTGQADSS